ncbi:hypothetical protein BVC71_09110 [Marivivens niveibacter]|uniref:Prepilin type IV endopeptidase peptidase domain-containing protein n=1 Tax=Marivivens niveibacter TaxID=1930667 RepID=A0A251WX77_9RHOB|nr:prepilin peptidase [Marivivens niveibacter]OUD08871.1 hypothetical protein BVC71_09110 [Marivivens niveibacter]
MDLTTTQAAWFLPAVAPICIYVAYSDLRSMKIPNKAVLALIAVFAVIGLIALPLDVWAWRWVHLVALLVAGVVANAVGLMGAGDAKFIAAAAPFVSRQDAPMMMYILAAAILIGVGLHRVAKYTALRKLAPNWESWSTGKRFPMGFPLGMALIAYLIAPFIAA